MDFTMNGISGQGDSLFEANPGGAPCNVLSKLQQLGKRTAFIGKVGDDSFDKMLWKAVAEQGIDTSNLVSFFTFCIGGFLMGKITIDIGEHISPHSA